MKKDVLVLIAVLPPDAKSVEGVQFAAHTLVRADDVMSLSAENLAKECLLPAIAAVQAKARVEWAS